jgi:hypothetical protein
VPSYRVNSATLGQVPSHSRNRHKRLHGSWSTSTGSGISLCGSGFFGTLLAGTETRNSPGVLLHGYLWLVPSSFGRRGDTANSDLGVLTLSGSMVPQDHSIGEIQKGPITKVNQPVTPGIELQAFLVGVSVGGELYPAPGCLASRRASQKASMKRKVSPTEILNHCATQRRRSESNRRMEVLQTSALPLGYGARGQIN